MNPVIAKLRRGEPALGGWIAFPSGYVAELMAHAGYDWVAIDWEHGAIGTEAVQTMLQGLHAGGVQGFVRIPDNGEVWVKRVLDMGADGLIAPMVCTADEARRLVQAVRFPPVGGRSVGLGRWRLRWDPARPPAVNDQIALVVMIEHIRGVEAVDRILAVDGVDACFVGPTDLGASLDYDPERTREAIARVLAAASRADVPAGIHARTPEDARSFIEQGFRLVAISEAGEIIRRTAADDLRRVRSAGQRPAD